ncbi:conjugative transposon protein TraM [Gramella sp. BOM4]|nr:conjugative transposon protein TraM [Christiangramia bathymodioli]
MKPDKRKLLVIAMLAVIIAFIIIYGLMIMQEDAEVPEIKEPEVPELSDEKKQYDTRLEAVDKLSEERPVTTPGLYDEDLIDKSGEYDPYLHEKQKIALMDSILKSGPDIEDYDYEQEESRDRPLVSRAVVEPEQSKLLKPIGQGHGIFFLQSQKEGSKGLQEGLPINVEVIGDQVVRKDHRLKLRLIEPFVIEDDTLRENSVFYAFCSFQPNRLLLNVRQVGNKAISMKAFDISDGQEGIYIENSFRSQAATEVIDDVIQDINISGLPQVSGLKGIFQRNNRSTKVKVLHQYQLLLKPVL